QIGAQISLARRWRIYEMGIRFFGRTYAEGKKIDWKDGIKALWYLLRFRLRAFPERSSSNSRASPPNRWASLVSRLSSAESVPVSWRAAISVSLGLFVLFLTVFAISPVETSTDSRWSIHTAMSFAQGRGGDLSAYLPILEKEGFYHIDYPDG